MLSRACTVLARCGFPCTRALLVMMVAAGCYPTTRMQTPRTTPPGRIHGAFGSAAARERRVGVSYAPDVALRIGVHERADLSLRLRPLEAEVGAKVQLLRDDVEFSIAPAVVIARDMDIEFDEATTAGDNVSVLAGRASLYAGSDAD